MKWPKVEIRDTAYNQGWNDAIFACKAEWDKSCPTVEEIIKVLDGFDSYFLQTHPGTMTIAQAIHNLITGKEDK